VLPVRATRHRHVQSLDGVWDIRADPDDAGAGTGWSAGFEGGTPIAVPASWNDQLPALRDFLGPAWYQVDFEPPATFWERRVRLRFRSINYSCDVWLNDRHLGAHEGGHLPFEFDAGEALRDGHNRLVVRVDARLAPEHVPPGNLGPLGTFGAALSRFPDTNFDFFPFAGIDRSVLLYATDAEALDEVTVTTRLDGTVHVAVSRPGGHPALVRMSGHGVRVSGRLAAGEDEIDLLIDDPKLWAPGSPHLYRLDIELERDGAAFDSHTVQVGIRTVAVDGDRLLLNGEPVVLRGFGRHEDFPIVGRGFVGAVMVRDFELLRWTGANSFRASHYPYAEEELDLADRLGVLVISETPAVGLIFNDDAIEARSALTTRFTDELIARDRNHPSVVIWSIANEPRDTPGMSGPFFAQLAARARSLDTTRPVTLASFTPGGEEALEHVDIVSLNRYWGWYAHSGRIGEAARALDADLDAIHARYAKPILVTEFGADAVAGHHAEPPEMFSEEYQAELIAATLRVLDAKPYVAGQHVWNLCDFKTPQSILRPHAINQKGVFTRDRRPKLAAHRLRELWTRRGPSG
jgi:beta-glucuronidase